jgi:hypothetical protein
MQEPLPSLHNRINAVITVAIIVNYFYYNCYYENSSATSWATNQIHCCHAGISLGCYNGAHMRMLVRAGQQLRAAGPVRRLLPWQRCRHHRQ